MNEDGGRSGDGEGRFGPGRIGRGWLARVWGADADFLIGDIREAAERRSAAGRGDLAVRLWVTSQVVRAVIRGWAAGPEGRPTRISTAVHGAGRIHAGLALRLAVRGLRRDVPTSTAVVGILALGIAAPAVFFSLLWGGGMRSLPVPEGDRVVRMEVVNPTTGAVLAPTSRDLETLRRATTLDGVAGWAPRSMTLRIDGWGATRLSGAALTAGSLDLLRVAPAIGRVPDLGESGAVLLSWGTWTELFGGDRDLVGRDVLIDGRAATIAGVMPDGFGFPLNHSAWVILDPAADEPVALFGRLADGIEPELAAAELTTLWRRGDELREPANRGGATTVRNYTRGRGESGEGILFLGLVVVGVALLVIASVNASNLLLVRAVERLDVLGVQAALGAGRLQLALQLLLEALVLSVGGGVFGLGLTHLVVEYIQASASSNFGYYWMRMQVEGPVILFVLALVLGTALVAGIVPIRRVLRLDLQSVLKRGAAGGAGREGWTARILTTAQLALSCAALVAAGLASRAIGSASSFGGDLPVDEVVIATLDLAPDVARSAAERGVLLRELETRLEAAAPSARVAVGLSAPGFFEPASSVEVVGVEATGDAARPTMWGAVGSGWLDLFDVEVQQGRALSPADDAEAPPVAVVSREWVRRRAGGLDPVGLRVRLPALDSATTWTIVGVVDDIPLGLGARVPADRIYLPLPQVDRATIRILMRRGDAPLDLVPTLRAALADLDPDLALSDPMTLRDAHAYMTRAQRTLSLLAAAGGYAGLLVAAVGLYGLLAFRVRRRRRELGVRLAMGADGRRLGREVLTHALRQIAPAMVIGLGLAWVASPILGAILLGNDARSPLTFAAVAALFVGTGLLSALRPALTASRVRPAEVLRAE